MFSIPLGLLNPVTAASGLWVLPSLLPSRTGLSTSSSRTIRFRSSSRYATLDGHVFGRPKLNTTLKKSLLFWTVLIVVAVLVYKFST
jgi:hypothetical protein